MLLTSLESLLSRAKKIPGGRRIAVAAADDISVIMACVKAKELGLIAPIFIGKRQKIKKIAETAGLNIGGIEIQDADDLKEAARQSVYLVKSGEADILMKGLIPTGILLKEVVHPELGILADSLLSHLGLFEIPDFSRLIGLTDAAMNIAPTVDEKIQIIRNAVRCLNKLGDSKPKVALLAAIEKVNEKMRDTVEADRIFNLHRENPVAECDIQGPLALDVAISEYASQHKMLNGPVAGNANLLVVPEITSGNILYKSLIYFAGAETAGIILGATSPVILTSRSDSDKSKLYSIALALCIC
jgi:phosphate butyryltransferase